MLQELATHMKNHRGLASMSRENYIIVGAKGAKCIRTGRAEPRPNYHMITHVHPLPSNAKTPQRPSIIVRHCGAPRALNHTTS
jgi:hypothetical protein